jgi:hypothetical protein
VSLTEIEDRDYRRMLRIMSECLNTVDATSQSNIERVRAVTGVETDKAQNTLMEAVVCSTFATRRITPPPMLMTTPIAQMLLDTWLIGLEMGRQFTTEALTASEGE